MWLNEQLCNFHMSGNE